MKFKGTINCSILFYRYEGLSYFTSENIYSLRVCDFAHALSHLNLTIIQWDEKLLLTIYPKEEVVAQKKLNNMYIVAQLEIVKMERTQVCLLQNPCFYLLSWSEKQIIYGNHQIQCLDHQFSISKCSSFLLISCARLKNFLSS